MGQDARRLALMALLTLWAVLSSLSFYAVATVPPDGEGSRMIAFLGLQSAASLPAFAAWVLCWRWPRGSSVRMVARVPLQLALGLGAVVGGLMLWAALMSAA